MGEMLFLSISIEFALFIFIDILGHKILKVKRSNLQKIFLVILLFTCLVTGYEGISKFIHQENSEKSATYLSFRYLSESDTASALISAESLKNTNLGKYKMIKAISSSMDEDYISAYFTSIQLLDDQSINNSNKKNANELNNVLTEILNLKKGNGSDEDEKIQLENIILSIINTETDKFSSNEKDKFEDLFTFDQKIRSGTYGDISAEFVKKLVERYSKDEEVFKLAINYFIGVADYKEAVLYAQKLVRLNNKDANYIIYTDVIAEGVSKGYKITPENDPEVKKLMLQASKLEKKADKYEDGSEKKEKLLLEITKIKYKADSIDIYRAINYLNAKKPLFIDTSGLYDLQKAKLYLAIDDTKTAKKSIYSAIDNINMVSTSSTVKVQLTDVINAYNQSVSDETSPQLVSSVNNLIKAQSQDVISLNDDTINGKISNYINSTLKYDKLGIHISKIDTSDYPNIKAYANINGNKEGIFQLANDFSKKDFELVDTGYQISDFKLVSSSESNKVDIAIVMDCSGSMSGQPLEDAKLAAKSCVNMMTTKNQSMSIVQYSTDAKIITNETNSKATLLNGIESINDGGDTNISAGVVSGIRSLSGNTATKAIILMTDGMDHNTQEAMDEAIQNAINQEILIYTVGLGDTNDAYLQDIADKTGGKFIKASNSTELENIYLTLQKYIVNNYCFSYTITNNKETDPRNLTIDINEYQSSASKKYSFSGKSLEEDDNSNIELENGSITIGAVTPSALSVADVVKGTQLTITGSSFEEGMHISIGNLELSDVKVIDATKCTGLLKGSLDAGSYNLKITSKDSQIASKPKALYVYKTGTTKSIKLGDTTITADTIGQTTERSFIASGNVLINGFIHCSDALAITAYDLPDSFDINSNITPYLGDNGAVSGNGKLYISYAQCAGNGAASDTFAKHAIGEKDYVIEEGEFALGVSESSTDIDSNMSNSKLTIPLLCTMDVPEMKLYSDRIQVNIEELNPLLIFKSIKKSIDNSVLSTSEDKDAADAANNVEKKNDAFKFWPLNTSANTSIAITADNIVIGATVGLESKDSISMGKFGIKKVELKLNSLDEDNEYWKISCEVDFSNIVKGFGGNKIDGLEAEIGSYYGYFDNFKVVASLEDGIPIYNVIYVDKLGLGLSGVSRIYTNTADTNGIASDLKLYGTFSAEFNLFKKFDIVVPEKMLDWGKAELVGNLGLNFSKVAFYADADFTLLDQKMGSAAIEFGKSGYSMNAVGEVEISIMDMQMKGSMNWGLKSNWTSYVLTLGMGGNIDWGLMNVHYSGNYEVDITAKSDGTYYGIELHYNNLISKYWYDSNGEPLFWSRFHGESYID
ncbi:MAG: VWA domain-containing protein [Lachnotalea sp.]